MLNKITKRIAAFACAALFAAGGVLAAPADGYMIRAYADGSISKTSGGYSTNNVAMVDTGFHKYDNQDKRVYSYLYQSSSDTLTRVESVKISDHAGIVVEQYDIRTGALKSQKQINLDTCLNNLFSTTMFGGFFAGQDYNYVVLGQENASETSIPVFCVLRFTKDFSTYKWSYLKDINTKCPFDAGSCRMTEAGGKLYIHTCHTMYKSSDGLNHQANMSFVVDEANLTFEQQNFSVSSDSRTGRVKNAFGYSSHSFDQFVLAEGSTIYAFDHGDAYPRSLRVHKYVIDSTDNTYGNLTYTDLVTIPGTIGDNYTSVLAGSMQLSTNNVIVGVKMSDMSNLTNSNKVRDIYILTVPKKNIGTAGTAKQVKLTSYGANTSISAPKIVKINGNKFVVLWKEIASEGTTTRIAIIDENGNLQGSIMQTNSVYLSDCDPILCTDGKVRWYATSNSSPVIFALDPNAPTTFSSGGLAPAVKSGDTNGDGSVTSEDVGLLQQYITRWQVTIDSYGADADGDGKINNKDVALLQQFLAGWNVTLGKEV